MILILDTDHLTVIQRQAEPAYSRLRTRLQAFPHRDVHTTIVRFEEQTRGWLSLIAAAKNKQQEVAAYRRLHVLLNFFGEIPVLEFDEDAAERFTGLRRLPPHIGPMDLKIAAIVLSQQGLLLGATSETFGEYPVCRLRIGRNDHRPRHTTRSPSPVLTMAPFIRSAAPP